MAAAPTNANGPNLGVEGALPVLLLLLLLLLLAVVLVELCSSMPALQETRCRANVLLSSI